MGIILRRCTIFAMATATLACAAPAPTGEAVAVDASAAVDAAWQSKRTHRVLLANVRRDPQSASAWHALARFLIDPEAPADCGGPSAAVTAANTACTLSPRPTAAQLVTLGTAQYLNGDIGDAVRSYRRALEIHDSGQLPIAVATELDAFVAELERESSSARM